MNKRQREKYIKPNFPFGITRCCHLGDKDAENATYYCKARSVNGEVNYCVGEWECKMYRPKIIK